MKTSYMYISSNNEEIELLNVKDFFRNYSGAPLNIVADAGDGKLKTRLLLAEMISDIIPIFKNSDKKEKIVFFRTIDALMARANCNRILYLGSNARLLEAINKIKSFFHPNAEIYWIDSSFKNDKSIDNVKILFMKDEDIILPSNFFDIVVAEFINSNSIDYLKTTLITASTKWATNIYLSGINEHKKIVDRIYDYKVYSVSKNYICEVVISKELKKATKEESVEYAVQVIQDTIQSRLLSLERKLCTISIDEYDDLIISIGELEQYVLNIRQYVVCTDISYYLNRFKESMIEYRLGFVDMQYVQNKLHECRENIERIW